MSRSTKNLGISSFRVNFYSFEGAFNILQIFLARCIFSVCLSRSVSSKSDFRQCVFCAFDRFQKMCMKRFSYSDLGFKFGKCLVLQRIERKFLEIINNCVSNGDNEFRERKLWPFGTIAFDFNWLVSSSFPFLGIGFTTIIVFRYFNLLLFLDTSNIQPYCGNHFTLDNVLV